MDELRALSTFVRVAELGSFNKAALAQATTPQAVSKTIRQLEQHLGVRLFHRTTRKNSLTEEGERLLHSARPNLDGLVEALTRARSAVRSDEGLVRVSAAGAVARQVLVPMLAAFQAQHPAIQIDLLLEDRFTDLVGERIDVGFRAGNPPEAQVIARRLFTIQQIVCASPGYFEQHAAPERLQDLLLHRCTAYRQPGTGRPMPWEFEVDGSAVFHHVPVVLCSSEPEADCLAVLAGIGLGQVDSINAAAALRDGRLVPVLTGHVSERMGLYLYYAQRADMPGRVRRFIDFSTTWLRDSKQFYVPPAELRALARRARAARR
ncbi:LysR family transcriptional regulator [Rhizobacter sp. OV335]|uniref:LysR family transcriptional regulator n=1 Tax=Rhizobacter sp. OV335 TaxID=1500264 RepID=UPI000920EDAC|nr:LysR family transcriptional regulator [Rhizobacter sp. OV335]SHN38549.1 DNA-binding transcriptional regulator, LysR family [Rhizobacter sp. OV335]